MRRGAAAGAARPGRRAGPARGPAAGLVRLGGPVTGAGSPSTARSGSCG